jgi:hypothetical protein
MKKNLLFSYTYAQLGGLFIACEKIFATARAT